MLVEFRVSNHRSIRDEQALSMEATTARQGDEAEPGVVHVEGHKKPLVTVAALYGPNAGGKSNVLSALTFMMNAVRDSFRRWSPNGGVPREPFALAPSRQAPSMFEQELVLDGVRYQYGFTVDDDRVLEEWLFAWPNGRRQRWLERDGDSFTFGTHLHGDLKVVEHATRPNALFLSAAFQMNLEQVKPLRTWFWTFEEVHPSSCHSATALHDRFEQFMEQVGDDDLSPQRYQAALQFLLHVVTAADTGIVDVRVTKRSAAPLEFRHRSDDEADGWLPFSQESRGTIVLTYLAMALIDSMLHGGGLLIVDELESGLHPFVVRQVLHLFQTLSINQDGAQLLFATHNSELLDTHQISQGLRRDQVWLVDKDHSGASTLTPLTDYRARKEENLQRGYLQGRYGGVPIVEPLFAADGS